jgi:transcription antitermination factor NusG
MVKANEPHRWFAAYTNSCQEKRVSQQCQVRDIESFLPVYRSTRRWKNGCTVNVEKPLFPGYVFVKVKEAHRIRVLELPGVVSIVGAARQPTPLPDTDIEALRNGVHLSNAEPHRYLEVGEKAKIRSGPFQGMTGILFQKRNTSRVVITLDLIMKSISVEVSREDLEIVGHEYAVCKSKPAVQSPHVHQ